MKICVAACSIDAPRRCGCRARRRRLGREADHAVALADGLFPVADARDEHLVVQRLPAFVDHDDRRLAVEPLARRGGRGTSSPACAGAGSSSSCGHVEADDARRQVELVVCVVEQPGVLAVARSTGRGARRGRRRAAAARRGTARGSSAGGGSSGVWSKLASTAVGDRRASPRPTGLAVGGEQLRQPSRAGRRGWPACRAAAAG